MLVYQTGHQSSELSQSSRSGESPINTPTHQGTPEASSQGRSKVNKHEIPKFFITFHQFPQDHHCSTIFMICFTNVLEMFITFPGLFRISLIPICPDPQHHLVTAPETIDGRNMTGAHHGYPLVNIQKTMENHHFQWVNPLFRLGHFQ